MKEWLLSVCAVVLLTVLLELIISEGKIKRYIQGVVRLALIVTMFVPIIKIVKSDVSFDVVEDSVGQNNMVDYNYLDRIYEMRYINAERELESTLKNLGINGAEVHISIYYGASGGIEIDFVTVDLSQAVISAEGENILLNEKIKDAVTAKLRVSEERIIISGG